MTAHFTVACTCHQCTRSRRPSPRRRPRRTAPSSSSSVPKPPTSPRPPKRQAGAQSHPMSSAGSPAWASSQSSTPRRPSGPTRKLPQAEVAVDRDPWPGRRPVPVQPADTELERRARLAQRVEEGQGVTEGVGGREPVDRSRVDGVDGGQRAAALGRQRAPGRGPLRVAQDLARDGLALQPLHHQPVGAQVVAHAHGNDGGHRDPRCVAAWSSERSIGTLPDWVPMSPRSIWRMSRRGAAPGASSSNALVTLDAPPESRCRSRTVPPRCAPSAAAISSPRSRAIGAAR